MELKIPIPIPLLPILLPEWAAIILLLGVLGFYILLDWAYKSGNIYN